MMKKRAAPALHLRHDIRVRGRRVGRGAQKSRVDSALPAIIQDTLTERVAADQAGAEQWQRHPEAGKVHQDVVRRSTGSLRLAANICQLFRLRKNINQLDLVNDPIATSKKTAPGRGGFAFHFLRRKG